MARRKSMDKGIVYILIAIFCLVIFFIGFNILKSSGHGAKDIDYNEYEVINVFSENQDIKVNTTNNFLENHDDSDIISDNFFLRTILESHSYMKQFYELQNGNINDLKFLFDKTYQIINPKSYIKSHLPAIFNLVDEVSSNEYQLTQGNLDIIDNDKEIEVCNQISTPLLDELKDASEISSDDKSSVQIMEDIIFVDPYEESNSDSQITKQTGLDFTRISEVVEIPKAFAINKNKPYILIYHTHTTESYLPITEDNYHSTKREYSVLKIGDIISEQLIKKGHNVKHVNTYHDLPSYGESYYRSLSTIKDELSQQNNIKVLIDIHRDGIPSNASYINKAKSESKVNINGKEVATFKFVIGPENANKEELIKFAKYIKIVSDQMYPGLCKAIIIKPYGRYNQFLSNYSTLLEIGSNLNTIDEAKESAVLIAQVLDESIKRLIK